MTNPFPVEQHPINPVVKARWVEALRSGNFKKGKGSLKENDRYCCLGVLTEIQGVNIKETYPNPEMRETSDILDKVNPGLLHNTCAILAGFNDDGFVFSNNVNRTYELPKKKNRFKQIADLIEKYL